MKCLNPSAVQMCPPNPDAGNHDNLTAKTYIRIIPVKNTGIDTPRSAVDIAK